MSFSWTDAFRAVLVSREIEYTVPIVMMRIRKIRMIETVRWVLERMNIPPSRERDLDRIVY
jgi:hypothetical protein